MNDGGEVVQIRSRRGTAEEWQNVDPVLAPGELGVEIDTGLAKLGNGEDTWNDLRYGAGGSPTLALSNDITESDSAVEYDAASASSVTIYWVFHDGARGAHSLNLRHARPGVPVFFLARNMTSEPQTLVGENVYWLAPGGAGVQVQTTLEANAARDSWLAANGAIVEDQQVGVACVLTVTT